MKAMRDGNRCGAGCNGATATNAVVYLPAGVYLVSTPIVVLFGTQFIGDVSEAKRLQLGYFPLLSGASAIN